jgi:hypothetical protein
MNMKIAKWKPYVDALTTIEELQRVKDYVDYQIRFRKEDKFNTRKDSNER